MLKSSMRHLKIYCGIAISKPIVTRALKISLIVGSTLNLINQGDALYGDAEFHLLKFIFTYLIPYSVTTYTATAMKIEFQLGTKSIIDADLVCKTCKYETHVKKDELIPECPHCGIKTKWRLK